MPRPCSRRTIGYAPEITQFGPHCGQPLPPSGEIVLALDELEAIRLADLEGLYQEQVAEAMQVSRQTLGRILDSAHRKVAEALVEGKMLRIEGGNIEMNAMRNFTCAACGHTWQVPFGTGRPSGCPSCASTDFHRSESPCGRGAGRGCCNRGAGGRRRQGQSPAH
jgi:predicted DNA-binding protein (UPF0251 family)